MSLTIKEEIYDLNDFDFWGGAVSRWGEIQNLGIENEILNIISEQFPNGLTKTDLNDFVWFDTDDLIEEMNENLEN